MAWEQEEQVADERDGGRFRAGVSGNPAGRPPRPRPAQSPLEVVLAGLARSMPEESAVNIARIATGQRPLPVPSAPHRSGENGWQRLLRLAHNRELDALAEMPQEEMAELARSLGGSIEENLP